MDGKPIILRSLVQDHEIKCGDLVKVNNATFVVDRTDSESLTLTAHCASFAELRDAGKIESPTT